MLSLPAIFYIMTNTISLLEDLIRIPSFVGNGCDEAAIANFVVAALSDLPGNWSVEQQPVFGNRQNVYVTNSDDPEILLTAHLDTVPPSDAWIRDPLVPVREGTRMYGLGAVDMKAGLSAIISTIRCGANTEQKIAALFYVGEEYDFCGMKAFVSKTTIAPRLIVNPEPTDLRVYRGCRGVLECRFSVEGRAAHSAMGKDGVNAIRVIQSATDDLVRRLALLPDEGLGISTVNLAWMRGGLPVGGEIVARSNVIPSFAEAVLEIRIANVCIDEMFVVNALSESIVRMGGKMITIDVSFRVGPMVALSIEKTPFDLFTSGDPKETGYFDTQLFIETRGGSAVVCGPGPSMVAHQADEYVDMRDLERIESVLAKLF